MVLATDEKQCYYVTKPELLCYSMFVCTHIVTTWVQALLFIPNCGTAVGVSPLFIFVCQLCLFWIGAVLVFIVTVLNKENYHHYQTNQWNQINQLPPAGTAGIV